MGCWLDAGIDCGGVGHCGGAFGTGGGSAVCFACASGGGFGAGGGGGGGFTAGGGSASWSTGGAAFGGGGCSAGSKLQAEAEATWFWLEAGTEATWGGGGTALPLSAGRAWGGGGASCWLEAGPETIRSDGMGCRRGLSGASHGLGTSGGNGLPIWLTSSQWSVGTSPRLQLHCNCTATEVSH